MQTISVELPEDIHARLQAMAKSASGERRHCLRLPDLAATG